MNSSDSRSGYDYASGGLRHMGVLRFTGPDAAGYLQGQLSNDTRRLTAGEALRAAYSSPQGRVLALLHLLPHSSGIIALLPRELVLPTLERLRKFVLRAKVTLEDLSEQFGVVGLHDAAAFGAAGLRLPEPAQSHVEYEDIGVARVSAGSDRCWVVGSASRLAQHGLAEAAAPAMRIEHDWRLADIRAGVPQIYAATSEMFVAQMLNLDLVDGISFTKGCFTGQEIIARTQHLGRIKRRMFRLRLPAGTYAIGQQLRLSDGRAGRLTELASSGDGVEALAVLNLDSSAPAAADIVDHAPAANAANSAGSAGSAGSMGSASAASSAGEPIAAHELPLPYALAQSA